MAGGVVALGASDSLVRRIVGEGGAIWYAES